MNNFYSVPLEVLSKICSYLEMEDIYVLASVLPTIVTDIASLVPSFNHGVFLYVCDFDDVTQKQLSSGIHNVLSAWLADIISKNINDDVNFAPRYSAIVCKEQETLEKLLKIFSDADADPRVLMPEIVKLVENDLIVFLKRNVPLTIYRLKMLCLLYAIAQMIRNKPKICSIILRLLPYLKQLKYSHNLLRNFSLYEPIFKSFVMGMRVEMILFLEEKLRCRETVGRFNRIDDWSYFVVNIIKITGNEFENKCILPCISSIIKLHKNAEAREALRCTVSTYKAGNEEIVALIVYMIMYHDNGYDYIKFGNRNLFSKTQQQQINIDRICTVANTFVSSYVKHFYRILLTRFHQ